jgi:hypothetical protein
MKKFKKFIEELAIATGTEMMRASQMRPTSFKDKSKYSRKQKHKNRQDKNSDDSFLHKIFSYGKTITKKICQIKKQGFHPAAYVYPCNPCFLIACLMPAIVVVDTTQTSLI